MQELDTENLQSYADEALSKRKWGRAATILTDILESEAEDINKSTTAYNLIVCNIKLGNPFKAQSALNKYSSLLEDSEREALQKEIYRIPTKMTENELKGLSWYKSNITLKDIIGLKKVKESIKEKILLPMQNQNLYKDYGIKTGGGFILYGPPGTGKTLLAKAVAGETGVRMLIANVKELVSKFQGESSKNISIIFNQAREGGPAIIFFDEIDALAQSRTSSNVSSTGGEDRRIANALLTELDGAQGDNSNVYVIGATNIPWELDDAVTRSGRFNQFIYVPPPDTKERRDLFKYYTDKLKIAKIDYIKLALMTFGFSPADIAAICKASAEHAIAEFTSNAKTPKPLTTKDFIWGIKQFPEPPLLKSYASALESLKQQSPEKLQQFNKMKEDIKLFVRRGKQRHALNNLIAKVM